jgi:hypothetical protein
MRRYFYYTFQVRGTSSLSCDSSAHSAFRRHDSVCCTCRFAQLLSEIRPNLEGSSSDLYKDNEHAIIGPYSCKYTLRAPYKDCEGVRTVCENHFFSLPYLYSAFLCPYKHDSFPCCYCSCSELSPPPSRRFSTPNTKTYYKTRSWASFLNPSSSKPFLLPLSSIYFSFHHVAAFRQFPSKILYAFLISSSLQPLVAP